MDLLVCSGCVSRDLIETSWNVKTKHKKALSETTADLIETSWNVKIEERVPEDDRYRFNRNIVECKAMSPTSTGAGV